MCKHCEQQQQQHRPKQYNFPVTLTMKIQQPKADKERQALYTRGQWNTGEHR